MFWRQLAVEVRVGQEPFTAAHLVDNSVIESARKADSKLLLAKCDAVGIEQLRPLVMLGGSVVTCLRCMEIAEWKINHA